jgi:hypothetical protein
MNAEVVNRVTQRLLRSLLPTGLVLFVIAWVAKSTGDFTVLYKAAVLAFEPVYDLSYFDSHLPGEGSGAPWAYPPTFLLMVLPFALVSTKAAYFSWIAVGAVAYIEAAYLFVRRFAWLILLSPLVIVPLAWGQTSLVVGALATAGLFLVKKPVVAGSLLALAACIKPQLLVLVPLGLIVSGAWRCLLSSILVGLALIAAATLTFGASIWLDWIGSITSFIDVNVERGNQQIRPDHPLLWAGAGICVVALVIRAFRTDDVVLRVVSALGGALLISPHSLYYDVAILGPVALKMLLTPSLRAPAGFFVLAGAVSWWPALLCVLAATHFEFKSQIVRAARQLARRYLPGSLRRLG